MEPSRREGSSKRFVIDICFDGNSANSPFGWQTAISTGALDTERVSVTPINSRDHSFVSSFFHYFFFFFFLTGHVDRECIYSPRQHTLPNVCCSALGPALVPVCEEIFFRIFKVKYNRLVSMKTICRFSQRRLIR